MGRKLVESRGLTLIRGGADVVLSVRCAEIVETRPRLTIRGVIQLHEDHGGWWELVVDAVGDVVIGAAFHDGWANSFPVEMFADADADGTAIAHDIGLPRHLWDASA
jgi:hypothetical protein